MFMGILNFFDARLGPLLIKQSKAAGGQVDLERIYFLTSILFYCNVDCYLSTYKVVS